MKKRTAIWTTQPPANNNGRPPQSLQLLSQVTISFCLQTNSNPRNIFDNPMWSPKNEQINESHYNSCVTGYITVYPIPWSTLSPSHHKTASATFQTLKSFQLCFVSSSSLTQKQQIHLQFWSIFVTLLFSVSAPNRSSQSAPLYCCRHTREKDLHKNSPLTSASRLLFSSTAPRAYFHVVSWPSRRNPPMLSCLHRTDLLIWHNFAWNKSIC